MGEFFVEVIRLGEVRKHHNADTLSVTTVHGGYPVCFKTGEFKEGDLAVYVPVDAVVPNTPEWLWLAPKGYAELRPKDRRIRAKRLRGVFSMGLLTQAPPGTVEGQDVAALMGIERWDDEPEPQPMAKPQKPRGLWALLKSKFYTLFYPHKREAHEAYKPKLKYLPGVYDIDSFRRYGHSTFEDGEVVVVTEKIHGQNASYVHDGKRLYGKSRTRWRDMNDMSNSNTWAQVAKRYKLADKLRDHPGIVLYGETYGNNQEMAYGVDKRVEGDRFMAFDAWDSSAGRWLGRNEFRALCHNLNIPSVPVLGTYVWTDELYERLLAMAEGETTVYGANHVREGFVIKTVVERATHPRAILKLAGEGYHTRAAA